MWRQGRFWSRSRSWKPRKRRPRKIELSERGIYEPVALEKDVVGAIFAYLWYSGVPVFIQPERIPRCPTCGAFVCAPSKAGNPDMHGWIPGEKFNPKREWALPFYLEVKRPKGGVEQAEQKAFIERMHRDNVPGGFVRSVEEVRALFMLAGCELPKVN